MQSTLLKDKIGIVQKKKEILSHVFVIKVLRAREHFDAVSLQGYAMPHALEKTTTTTTSNNNSDNT